MAIPDWGMVCGQEFSLAEAGEVSDFEEVLHNWGLEPDVAYKIFGAKELNATQRIYFAAKLSIDVATEMLFNEGDARLRAVIQNRLATERKRHNGGIII